MSLPLSKIRDLSFKTSIYGIEERIVLDIGSCYLKCGFSGEARPRHFVSMFLTQEALDDYLGQNTIPVPHLGHACSEFCNERTNDSCRRDNPREYAELYDLDISRATGQDSEAKKLRTLEDRLSEYLYDVYFKHLLTDPKQRKVIICESPLAPIALKQTIAKVLFEKLQVPSVSFTPTHLLALLTTGTATGLTIDCGHLETTILPIYSSRPMTPFIRTTPRAGKFLTNRLKQLLLRHGTTYPADSPTDIRPVPEYILTSAFLETLKTRILYASPLIIRSHENVAEEEMEDRYRMMCGATELSIEIWLSEEQSRGVLVVPGWVRERASECLFDGDEDEESMTATILGCIAKLPSDLRRPMISSLLLIGGTAHLPNIQNRLLMELKRELQTNKRWKTLSGLAEAVHFLDDLTPEEESNLQQQQQAAAAAAAAAAESHGGASTSSGRSSRSDSQQDLYSDLELKAGSERRGSGQSGGSSGGKAPMGRKTRPTIRKSSGKVFMPNCRGWIGGSLVGSLKTSGPEILKERFSGEVPDWSNNNGLPSSAGGGVMTALGASSGGAGVSTSVI